MPINATYASPRPCIYDLRPEVHPRIARELRERSTIYETTTGRTPDGVHVETAQGCRNSIHGTDIFRQTTSGVLIDFSLPPSIRLRTSTSQPSDVFGTSNPEFNVRLFRSYLRLRRLLDKVNIIHCLEDSTATLIDYHGKPLPRPPPNRRHHRNPTSHP